MLEFPGVQLVITEEAAFLSSNRPLYTLASAVIGGGFQRVCSIINRHVPYDYNCADPVADLQRFADIHGLHEPFVGLLTGVPMHGTRMVTVRSGELTVTAITTAGVSNAISAGLSEPVSWRTGTINMIILIDALLVEAAMVNAIITATEAKTSILTRCALRTLEGYAVTGTSTDAIVIACTGRGDALPYAGPATQVGALIGRSVRQCLLQALEPCGVFPKE